MGADLWQFEVPGHTDPEQALEALQARVFEEYSKERGLDLQTMLREAIPQQRKAIEAARAEGDPYDLVEYHEGVIESLEPLCAQPLPSDTAGKIELLRKIMAAHGEPISNVLDTTGVTHEWGTGPFLCKILSNDEILQFVGSRTPTLAQCQQVGSALYSKLARGDSACWNYYDERTNPLGWFFTGAQFD
jgi:hypothetical protein